MSGQWWQYLLVITGSAVLCTALTPIAIRIAVQKNLLDHPGMRKIHSSPIPYLGGMAIVIAFTISLAGAAAIEPPESGMSELFLVLVVALTLAGVGLLDDLRNLSPPARLIVEIACASIMWIGGIGVEFSQFELLNFGLTLLWFVGITNAFNLLDNMDGLAAGLAAVSCLTFFFMAQANGQFLVASLAIALCGCALGFLRHNFFPARVYMGDSGALFLGFLVAYLGAKIRMSGGAAESFLPRAIACSVPILDTTLVVISRLRSGRGPFEGGQDHLSHRLIKLGLSVPISVSTIYYGSAFLGSLAFVMTQVPGQPAWILFGTVITTLVLAATLLLRVDVYPETTTPVEPD